MTFHHGVGSLNSPIVISDDEDEAYVEFALEQRISSPTDDDFDNDEAAGHTSDFRSTAQGHSHLQLYQSTSRDQLPGVPPNGAQGMFWVLVVL